MDNKDRFEVSEEVEIKIFEHASKLDMPDLLNAIEAFNKATVEEHANWHPGLGLELAFTSYLVAPEPQIRKDKQRTVPVSEQPKKIYQTNPQPTKKTQEVKPKSEKPERVESSDQADDRNEISDPVPNEQESDISPEEPEVKSFAKREGQITVNEVYQAWQEIKDRVGRHNRRTEGLLNTAKLTGVDGNALILGFSSDTLKKMMEKEGNITLTADILEEVLSQPMSVKCIVTSHQGSALPKNIKIDKDGMVSTATRDLGGKISSAEEIQD